MAQDTRYLDRMEFTEAELQRRKRYFRIGEADLERLAAHRDFAEERTEPIVEAFYDHLLGHPETRDFLSEPGLVERLQRKQTSYFLQLFHGRLDLDYVENRLRIGAVHERLGIPPTWYIGAYSVYLRSVHEHLIDALDDEAEARAVYGSLEKLMHFDAALALDAYIAAHLDTTRRQQAAIRELSTPVIKVHDRILLLPLVGTVDSLRAQQIMQSVLQAVADAQAKVVILDIAGVPVVDTQVADYLLKTTAAVRLLGTQVILTGISPQVARTIVELGVDISTMSTRNRLSDGVELALQRVGKRIVAANEETP